MMRQIDGMVENIAKIYINKCYESIAHHIYNISTIFYSDKNL